METIINALERIEAKYEVTERGVLVKGKIAGVKTKLNKGLKPSRYKVAKAKYPYFGEYEFKQISGGGTYGGFDMVEENGYTRIYSRGGTGYNGID